MKKILFMLLTMMSFAVFAENPLANPGFEDGVNGWRIAEDVSKASPEAAHSGTNGLRVKIDTGLPYGSSVFTSRLPVDPGKNLTLTFWAKTNDKMLGVYLYYYDKDGKVIKAGKSDYSGGLPMIGVSKADGKWNEYILKSIVPENAVAVDGWIHAYSSQVGTVDLDDFVFTGLKEGVQAIHVKQKPKKSYAQKPINKALPEHPPVIILKLDDMTQRGSKGNSVVSPSWQKLVDFLEKENIKASLGIIGSSLENDNQAYFDWLKTQNKKEYIEFWNHGQTHKELPKVNNKRRCEFNAPFAEQKATLQQTQQLVKDKTGIVLKAFGAPFNVTNTDTEKALEEFPEIDIWFFGSNKTKESKKLILKRVINLEQPTMSPNSAGLIRDYEYKGKFEPYLVLQGHPNGWDDRKFNEFAKSVAYLKGKGCKFMTVSEYYEQQKK